jgi:hypothetical protein
VALTSDIPNFSVWSWDGTDHHPPFQPKVWLPQQTKTIELVQEASFRGPVRPRGCALSTWHSNHRIFIMLASANTMGEEHGVDKSCLWLCVPQHVFQQNSHQHQITTPAKADMPLTHLAVAHTPCTHLQELQARFESCNAPDRANILDALLQVCGPTEVDFLKRVISRRAPLSSGRLLTTIIHHLLELHVRLHINTSSAARHYSAPALHTT